MINWYKKVVFENYANFKGRARRSEYWYFALINFIICMIAMVMDNILGFKVEPLPYGYFYIAYALFALIPGLAVIVRRLHDVGKSGWFFFIVLIPLVGAIWLLVLFCKAGDQGTNKYGTDPKGFGEEINEIGVE